MPVACISAYAVVGPTNRNPRRFSSLASAVDSGVTAGTSAIVPGRGRDGGANDHSSTDRPSGRASANRAKIEATRRNARATLDLDTPLDELLWSFAPDPAGRARPKELADVPAVTPESTAMAKELKRRGFGFVGPITCYALMQATGMVDDHLDGCLVGPR